MVLIQLSKVVDHRKYLNSILWKIL